MKIVLGLGNPGPAYSRTRHNVGFWVLDRLAHRRRTELRATGDLRRYAWWAEVEGESRSVVLAKPRTFMNRTGRAAAALCRRFDASPAELLVVYDDADLELGRVRLRAGGGSGGHNGIRSLIDVLGVQEFPRVRLGVRGEGRDERDLADYVLSDFLPSEAPIAEALADLAADAVDCVLTEGLATAMNRYNGRRGEVSNGNDREEGQGVGSSGPRV